MDNLNVWREAKIRHSRRTCSHARILCLALCTKVDVINNCLNTVVHKFYWPFYLSIVVQDVRILSI